MSLRELLNLTQASMSAHYGGDAIDKVLAEVEADTPEAQARLEADQNRAWEEKFSKQPLPPIVGS